MNKIKIGNINIYSLWPMNEAYMISMRYSEYLKLL